MRLCLVSLFSFCIVLAGCTNPRTIVTVLNPQPNTCQTDTARPDYLSNSTFTHCWDADGRHIGMVGGQGTTVGKVMMGNLGGVIRGAAIVGGAIGAAEGTD